MCPKSGSSQGSCSMLSIMQRVRDVQIRQQRQWLWQCVSAGTGGRCDRNIGSINSNIDPELSPGCGLQPRFWHRSSWPAVSQSSIPEPCSSQRRTIDSQCGLKDRTETAMQFLASAALAIPPAAASADAALRTICSQSIHQSRANQSSRIMELGHSVNGACLHPLFLCREATGNIGICGNQFCRFHSGGPRCDRSRGTGTVSTGKSSSPELEETLRELALQLTELKAPGLDPKEALAKLSEMESALQEMQQQIAEASVEAQLQEVVATLLLWQRPWPLQARRWLPEKWKKQLKN